MPTPDHAPSLRTPGRMACELGVPLHRVLYVLATRSHIRPTARAGTLRLFDAVALAQVNRELDTIDARCSRAHPSPPCVPAELPTDPDELRPIVRDLMAYIAECFAESSPHGVTKFVPPSAAQLDAMVDRVVAQHLAEQNSEVSRA